MPKHKEYNLKRPSHIRTNINKDIQVLICLLTSDHNMHYWLKQMMRQISWVKQGLAIEWILDAGCWMLDAGCWMLDAGCWMLDAGCWMLDAGCWMLDAGCWMLDAGCWMLDAGCWMLDAGCWMLDNG